MQRDWMGKLKYFKRSGDQKVVYEWGKNNIYLRIKSNENHHLGVVRWKKGVCFCVYAWGAYLIILKSHTQSTRPDQKKFDRVYIVAALGLYLTGHLSKCGSLHELHRSILVYDEAQYIVRALSWCTLIAFARARFWSICTDMHIAFDIPRWCFGAFARDCPVYH